MTLFELALFIFIYFFGLILLRKSRSGLIGFLWGSFGFAGIFVLAGQVGGWNAPLGFAQTYILQQISNSFGFGLRTLQDGALIVPDPTGWSVLYVGIECSALIEAAIFTGLMIFYPAFLPAERISRLGIGLILTFLLNLIRLAIIIVMVATLGKSSVPLAHAVVGRLVFFFGILVIYWQMLTLPTLGMVRRGMEVTQRNLL
jgi:exosortase family protein XrtG